MRSSNQAGAAPTLPPSARSRAASASSRIAPTANAQRVQRSTAHSTSSGGRTECAPSASVLWGCQKASSKGRSCVLEGARTQAFGKVLTVAPQRLLTWRAEQGWDGLCGFLGVPVPQEPFPHTNRKEEFFKMHAREDR